LEAQLLLTSLLFTEHVSLVPVRRILLNSYRPLRHIT
jgi:hypothetical protein